eukprot:4317395-Pleurochrysis_carterae.AAC.1
MRRLSPRALTAGVFSTVWKTCCMRGDFAASRVSEWQEARASTSATTVAPFGRSSWKARRVP